MINQELKDTIAAINDNTSIKDIHSASAKLAVEMTNLQVQYFDIPNCSDEDIANSLWCKDPELLITTAAILSAGVLMEFNMIGPYELNKFLEQIKQYLVTMVLNEISREGKMEDFTKFVMNSIIEGEI